MLALDAALESPAKADERKSRGIELSYFDGLSIKETADAPRISIDTAKRDWHDGKGVAHRRA